MSKTYNGGLGDTATQLAWMAYADANDIPHDHEDETVFKDGYHAGRKNVESLEAQLAQAEDACHQMQTERSATDAVKAARLEIAEEIENHSYLAGTHEMCIWIDGLTKRLREEKSLSEICDELSGRYSHPPNDPVRLSSWENCPLCDSAFIEVHEDPIYKPEVVCTDCGITLQGETVFAIKERWNKR